MLKTGDQAIDFELTDFKGQKVKLFELLSQTSPLLLIFYKDDCPTCQYTFQHLPRIAREAGGEYFLGVAQDGPDQAKAFRDKYGFESNIVCDIKPYAVSRQYGVDVVPTFFVVEADRSISYIAEGFDKKVLEQFSARVAVKKGLQSYVAFSGKDYIPLLKPG
jgi:peroxiredoxin